MLARMLSPIAKGIQGSHIMGSLSLFSVLVLASGAALAQEPATSLDELKLVMGKGDRITLVDQSGKSMKGRVERLVPDALDLKVNGEVRSFSKRDIRQITQTKPDSPLNGILIGAAVAFGATLPFNLAYADGDHGLAVAASGLWGLIGGGIGALVDACVQQKQLIYFQPKRSVSWNLSPVYSNFTPGPQATGHRAISGGINPTKGFAVTVRF